MLPARNVSVDITTKKLCNPCFSSSDLYSVSLIHGGRPNEGRPEASREGGPANSLGRGDPASRFGAVVWPDAFVPANVLSAPACGFGLLQGRGGPRHSVLV